ncbi:DUF6252 family protein [Flavobacterium sp. RSP15]|uniref:DUF6252 family protein n=1 Tax=Flavobacterium sp. RSP15 TaxID=2497485 RepID=UPI000F81E21F|nr:DUF6252 family protein [Flavobacterium sp. RSP15]RTY85676.1 hypothetical protein EKM00_13470 [Flavobacterium sp. RSP15]
MKKYLIFLGVLFLMISCAEEVSFNTPSLQGRKDNVFWRATASKATLASDGLLVIEGFTGNEVLTLKTTSISPQVYPLGTSNSKRAVYVLTGGSDVSFATGIDMGSGQIVITDYDEKGLTVTGTFKFSAENANGNPSAGTVLNFQQGVFYKVPVSLRVP